MPSSTHAPNRILALALAPVALLTGCANLADTPAAPTAQTHILSGHVHGGQQPVVGATVQLYSAGTSGYGSASTPLLTTSVVTASDGSFNITGDYTCPSPSSQVYLTATGGDAGAGVNPASVLISGLGSCSTLANTLYITINEVSTVASAYALAPFMSPGSANVGTSGTNALGLANAFATIPNLLDLATGNARTSTPAGNGTVPQRSLNTLANIIASCINTTGAASTPCSTLFAYAHATNDPPPTDTLGAILNIALNPALHVADLYPLPTASAPFQPALSAQPNDWTVSVVYTGGGLGTPGFPAVDATGNLWVPNAGATILSAFSPTGTPLASSGYTGGGLTQSVAAAVDLSGSIWVTNAGTGSISKFSPSGTALSSTSGFLAGTGAFDTLAVDPGGDLFVSQGVNNTVYKLNPAGATLATITGGTLNGSWGLAVDSSSNLWVTDHAAAALSKFSNAGVPVTSTGYTGAGLYQPYQAAIDRDGAVWIADRFPSVSQFSSSGVPVNSAGYAIAAATESIAIDGDNTVWTANTDGSVSHLSTIGNALSPANGFQPGSAAGKGIALDASGNVWTTDTSGQVYQIVGAAAPVTTPIAQAVQNNTLGTRP